MAGYFTLAAMQLVHYLLNIIIAMCADRQALALENAALRQQIIVMQRSIKRAKIDDGDRMFWILLSRLWKDWAKALVIVKPETVIRWHKKGFAYYWGRKSRSPAGGRPPITDEIIELIVTMSTENVTWGSPKIQNELRKLGHEVAKSTVERYMVKRDDKDGARQNWRTFIRNHMDVSAACDFFTVPTLTFKVLYVFVVLSHDRRRIVHFNVTEHPTSEWTAQQIVEAFPCGEEPRFLHRDRDKIYGDAFKKKLKALGIEEVISAPKSPWQNPFVERVIGTLRRDCTDHVIALSEKHLRRVLGEYVNDYYDPIRCHLSLDGDAPIPRRVERSGKVVSTPILGGLHHRYSRAA